MINVKIELYFIFIDVTNELNNYSLHNIQFSINYQFAKLKLLWDMLFSSL